MRGNPSGKGVKSCNHTIPEANVGLQDLVPFLIPLWYHSLSEQEDMLLSLSRALIQQGLLDAENVAAIAAEHGLSIAVKPEGFVYTLGYMDLLNQQG